MTLSERLKGIGIALVILILAFPLSILMTLITVGRAFQPRSILQSTSDLQHGVTRQIRHVPRMKAQHIQQLLGAIFLLLGLWALVFPAYVEAFVLEPNHFIGTTASAVLIGCFGAQAVLCSILIFTTSFSARTFLVFGVVGSIPFIVFNYYFVFVTPIFTNWMLLDFVGNVGILLCGVIGWRIKLLEETASA